MEKTIGNNRYFYAGQSYMGTNFSYDSPCWKAYRFESKKARDEFVSKNEYKDGNRVTEEITQKTAMKIIGFKRSSLVTGQIFENEGPDNFLIFAFQ